MTAAQVIAIDGPAASGKSSTAAAVARALGFSHLDSGSLYRALTWVAASRSLDDAESIIAAAESLHVALVARLSEIQVHVDALPEVEAAIRAPAVNARVSAIAAMPKLRNWVNARMLEVIEEVGAVVIDGRDIGTVVVPDAQLKIFLTATAHARAERRLAQDGRAVDRDDVATEAAALAERDRRDSDRAAAPLRQAADAIVVDTTALTFAEQVSRIVGLARSRGMGTDTGPTG